jgi:periplasmic copper chaperone A
MGSSRPRGKAGTGSGVRSALQYVLGGVAVLVIGAGVLAAVMQSGSSKASETPTAGAIVTPEGTPVAAAAGIQVFAPVARVTFSGSSAMYFMIRNSGPTDALTGLSCDAAGLATLYDSVVDAGTSTMRSLQRIDVPANGTATLQVGGLHVMLEQLPRPLTAGDQVRCRLEFEHAGELALTVPVRDYGD